MENYIDYIMKIDAKANIFTKAAGEIFRILTHGKKGIALMKALQEVFAQEQKWVEVGQARIKVTNRVHSIVLLVRRCITDTLKTTSKQSSFQENVGNILVNVFFSSAVLCTHKS